MYTLELIWKDFFFTQTIIGICLLIIISIYVQKLLKSNEIWYVIWKEIPGVFLTHGFKFDPFQFWGHLIREIILKKKCQVERRFPYCFHALTHFLRWFQIFKHFLRWFQIFKRKASKCVFLYQIKNYVISILILYNFQDMSTFATYSFRKYTTGAVEWRRTTIALLVAFDQRVVLGRNQRLSYWALCIWKIMGLFKYLK